VERRRYPRIAFEAPAFLHKEANLMFGAVKDVSLNGMYLSVRGEHVRDEEAVVSIYLLKGPATLSVTLPGRIVRQGADGIGFNSPHIDPYTLLNFESILSHNSQDSPQLMAEFFSYISSQPGVREFLADDQMDPFAADAGRGQASHPETVITH